MTKSEFERWLEHYMAVFPETAEWIGRVSDERRLVMLTAWAKLLADVEYRDVMAATERMFAGDNPAYRALGVLFGDREKTASHVRRLAKELHAERVSQQAKRDARRQSQGEQVHGGATRYRYSMGQLYRFLVERQDAGDPDAVAKMRAMADELPGPGDRGYAPADGYQELFAK